MHLVVDAGHPTGRAETHPLVVELRGDQLPATVLLADEHVGGHVDVVVVRRVGVVCAVGQDDRRPRVARIFGVDDQDRNTFVLGGFRIRTAGQPDVVGVVRAGRPHLLAVHDVLVTLFDGRGPQRRQVRTGLGFGVTDREMDVAGKDAGKELLLLRLGAVDLQRRTDRLQRDQRERHVGAVGLVDEDLLLDRTEAEAAVLLRPAHAELSVGPHPLDHGAVGLIVAVGRHRLGFVGRDQSRKVLAQLGLQTTLLRRQFDVHVISRRFAHPGRRPPDPAGAKGRRATSSRP